MLRAVLFDLDGTLLDIDLGSFFNEYFAVLAPTLADLTGPSITADEAVQAVLAATARMDAPHPGATNAEIFDDAFAEMTGVRISEPSNTERLERFYLDAFPALGKDHGPMPGGREAYRAARALGLKVALATNPIFPRLAIVERLRWAGFTADEFDFVTDYETMEATKPDLRYYRDIATALGVSPDECLMVGDDPVLDLSAADTGMRTYLARSEHRATADWHGSLDDLACLLPRLAS